ncbi:hypothetical protein Scep_028103 [Stephania cephalantha]|uniref:Vitellogenin n=1 Tax=Stephania cephalantha TaxID=152367 RepID=A0AAP0E9B5_9MAGN
MLVYLLSKTLLLKNLLLMFFSKNIEHHNLVDDMMLAYELSYRPQTSDPFSNDPNIGYIIPNDYVSLVVTDEYETKELKIELEEIELQYQQVVKDIAMKKHEAVMLVKKILSLKKTVPMGLYMETIGFGIFCGLVNGESILSSTSATKIYTSPDIEEIASFMKGEPLSKEVQLIRGENENFNIKAETMTVEEVKRQRSKATTNGKIAIPIELSEIVGRSFTFKLKLANYNLARGNENLTVSSVCHEENGDNFCHNEARSISIQNQLDRYVPICLDAEVKVLEEEVNELHQALTNKQEQEHAILQGGEISHTISCKLEDNSHDVGQPNKISFQLGKIGALLHRGSREHAIEGKPPYLKVDVLRLF